MCRPVHQEVEFSVPPRVVYDAYLDSRQHSRFTGQRARMSRREGGSFEAGDEYISGYNLELVPGERIVQAWRGSDFPEGVYSVLTLELRRKGKGTSLTVDQVGVPEELRDSIDQGWHEFYWDPMKEYFGTSRTARTRRPARRR